MNSSLNIHIRLIHLKPLEKTITVILLSAAVLCCPAAWGRTEDTALGFAKAWQRLTSENDTLAAAQANLDQARQKKDAAKDLYLPEIIASANYLYLDEAVTLSPNDLLDSMAGGTQLTPLFYGLGRSYGLSSTALDSALTSTLAERENRSADIHASWPLYAGGRIDAAQDIAAGLEKEAGQKLAYSRQEQFESLARFYFGSVLAGRVLQTRRDVADGLKKHLERAVLLEKQGQIAKVERLQAEAAHDKAEVDRRKADHELHIALTALSTLLKSSQTVIPADDLFIKGTLPPKTLCLEQTLANHPGLGQLQAKHEQASGLAALEEGKYYPSVAIFGTYNLYEEDNLASKLVPDWFLGLGMKLPLLDRSGRSGNLQAAKSAIRQVKHLENQTRNDLALLVENTYRQTEQAIEEYRGLESSQRLAEETVHLRRKSFSQGLSTTLDVVDAEMFLAGIKTQRAVAAYGYVIGLAKLLAVSGQTETFFAYQTPQNEEIPSCDL